MKIEIVTPSRGNLNNLSSLIKSFSKQKYKNFNLIILIDKNLIEQDLIIYKKLVENSSISNLITLVTNLNSSFIPNLGVSYVRNYGINIVNSKYLFIIDDDNVFDGNFLLNTISQREQRYMRVGKDYLLAPTIMNKNSGMVLNQGFKYFNYFLSKPKINYLGKKEYGFIKMYGGNSLFGPSNIFKNIKFDEKIDYVYEDLDFSYRVFKNGYPILVLRDLKIYHMERDKNDLEHAFVGDENSAYRKSKHRIIFVKKNGTLIEKVLFFTFGLRIQSAWLIFKILIKGKKINNKFVLIKFFFKGIYDGIKNSIK